MSIKKLLFTAIFSAIGVLGYGQEQGQVPELGFIEVNREFRIFNATGLYNLNVNWDDVDLEGKTIVFEKGEYNLTDQNWISKIDLNSTSVEGNGAKIKFKSTGNADSEATGLFNSIMLSEVIIKDLTIEAEITFNSPESGIGILAANADGESSLSIISVNVSGTIGFSDEAKGKDVYAGGVIGSMQCSSNSTVTIDGCKSDVKINGASVAGGIVGYINSGQVNIRNCVSNSEIKSTDVAGGIVGKYETCPGDEENPLGLKVSSCANTGKIEVDGGTLGGILGVHTGISEVNDYPVSLSIDHCCNTGQLIGINNAKVGSLLGQTTDKTNLQNMLSNSFVLYSGEDILSQNTHSIVYGIDQNTQASFTNVTDNSTNDSPFSPFREKIVIEPQEDFNNLGMALTAYMLAGMQPTIDIRGDFKFTNIEYSGIKREGEIEKGLDGSVGWTVSNIASFNGTIKGDGTKFYNYAVNQNSLLGNIGEYGVVEGVCMPNAIVIDDLSNSVTNEDGNKCAAVFANKNSGVISYCSYVGVVSVPVSVDANKVITCLVGESSEGSELSYSFMYATNLSVVKDITDGETGDGTKAAIIIKGNMGVGKKAGGKVKKVAVNTTSSTNKTLALDIDAYFTPDDEELKKNERAFTNDEFASGVVAYWLNYAESGYTGEYTCRYSQGEYTPELQSEATAAEDGGAAIHKILYDIPTGSSILSGSKPFANGGETVTLTLSHAVKSATVTVGESNKSASVATISADGKTITFDVPKTKKPVVTLTASNNTTALSRVEPNAEVKIVVIDGKVRVFGAQGEVAVVYGVNGAVLHTEVLASDTVDLPVVPHGIYFVKVGGATKKIVL